MFVAIRIKVLNLASKDIYPKYSFLPVIPNRALSQQTMMFCYNFPITLTHRFSYKKSLNSTRLCLHAVFIGKMTH